MKRKNSIGFALIRLSFAGVLLLAVACGDHRTTITVDLPEYKPELTILSYASPISGARAVIRWSVPLRGVDAVVPELPEMEVFLLRDGQRIHQFIRDSAGYYSIAAASLELEPDEPYALEVQLDGPDRGIFSGDSYLPEQPRIGDVEATALSERSTSFDLSVSLGTHSGEPGAFSFLSLLVDKDGRTVPEPGLFEYVRSSYFTYLDKGTQPERTITSQNSRVIQREMGAVDFAGAVDVRAVYFSPEIARFIREVDEFGYFGEDIFQTVKPVYSNIRDGVGIFGVFNEKSVVAEIEIETINNQIKNRIR